MIIAFLRYTGIWHRGIKPTAREFKAKLFYCIYHLMGLGSLTIGAITNEKHDQTVFLTAASIAVAVYVIKLWNLIWKQDEILDLLNRICQFTIRIDDDYHPVNEKCRKFAKLVTAYVIVLCVGFCIESIVIPFFGNERTLFSKLLFLWIGETMKLHSGWQALLFLLKAFCQWS